MSVGELEELIQDRYASLDVARESIAVVEEEKEDKKAPEEDFAPHDE
jgi:hypothetical protein